MIILPLVVAILWAIYPFLFKQTSLSPIENWAIINILSGVCAIIVLIIKQQNVFKRASPRDLTFLAGASLVGPILGSLIYLYCIHRIPNSTNQIIALAFTSPLFAFIISYAIFDHKLRAAAPNS